MYDFVPDRGDFATEAKEFMRELGRRLTDRSCDPRSNLAADIVGHSAL